MNVAQAPPPLLLFLETISTTEFIVGIGTILVLMLTIIIGFRFKVNKHSNEHLGEKYQEQSPLLRKYPSSNISK